MFVKMAIMTHPIRKEHLKVTKFILMYGNGSPYTNYFGYQLMLIADLTIDVDRTKINVNDKRNVTMNVTLR